MLAAEMSGADLQCESELSEEDAGYVREFIRDNIADMLESKATPKAKRPKHWPKRWKPLRGAM